MIQIWYLGVALICLIVTFGLISLAISIFNRRASSTHPVRQVQEQNIANNNDTFSFKVKLVNAGGIVKSYAKIPVEVKNMLPSNVAYRQLYDVWKSKRENMCINSNLGITNL